MHIKVLWTNSRTLEDTVPGGPQRLALHTESREAGEWGQPPGFSEWGQGIPGSRHQASCSSEEWQSLASWFLEDSWESIFMGEVGSGQEEDCLAVTKGTRLWKKFWEFRIS